MESKINATPDVLVLLQQAGDDIHPISLELAAAALPLAEAAGGHAFGVLIAGRLGGAARQSLATCGLRRVYVYEDDAYAEFIAELHCAPLAECIETLRPGTVLVGATPEGRALAPMTAVRFGTGVTADCTELSMDENGLLLQTRPAFGGNVMACIITPEARPQMATVRYGVLRAAPGAPGAAAEIVSCPAAHLPRTAATTAVRVAGTDAGPAAQADIVLALGGGLADKEDIALFEALCRQMGAALMCSRSLVERGWFPQSSQIGLSGRSIAPKLLITLGVSGSVQFAAGIQGAERICAVNSDENAPILKMADVPIVGDLYDMAAHLPALLA